MSAQQGWALQQAVYSRIAAQLVGQAPDGTNIPIYDHIPANPPRIHARIDGFHAMQRPLKANATQHAFSVHVFDRPTSESSGARGQKFVRGVQNTIIAALHGWTPGVTGATAIRHEDSYVAPDEDGVTAHAYSRFSTYVK